MIDVEIDRLIKQAKHYLVSISVDTDPEITTLLHRYICILLSSNIDKAIQLIFSEFARVRGNAQIARFIAKKHQRGANYNTKRIVHALSQFDPQGVETFVTQIEHSKLKEQIDSLYGLRNSISHGVQVNVSRPSIDGYFEAHTKIIHLIKSTLLG